MILKGAESQDRRAQVNTEHGKLPALATVVRHKNTLICRETGLSSGRGPRLLIRAAASGGLPVVASRRAVRSAAGRRQPGRAAGPR